MSEFETIVVDNASSDGSASFVKNNYPWARLIEMSSNSGFTGGNIEGLKQARGSLIALLNNDTIASPVWLESLAAEINKHAKIGMCSSNILIYDTNLIDSLGDRFTTAFNGTKIGHMCSSSEFGENISVAGVCAAAALYKKKMLDEIGFFDEDFFFNHEDTDLNMRAWLAGWKTVYAKDAVVWHKVSATVGHLSDKTVYFFARNNVWVWLKNLPLPLMILYLPHRMVYEFASLCYYCIIHGKWRAYFNGKIDAFQLAGKMIKKRRIVQKNISVSLSDIKEQLIPITTYLYQRLCVKNAYIK